jgi:hypothetical protein
MPLFRSWELGWKCITTRTCPRPASMENTAVLLYHWWAASLYLWGWIWPLSVPICSRWGGAFGTIMGPPLPRVVWRYKPMAQRIGGGGCCSNMKLGSVPWEPSLWFICLLVLFCCGLLWENIPGFAGHGSHIHGFYLHGIRRFCSVKDL